MARERDQKKKDFARYCTDGQMDFSVNGYVQKIQEGENVDYVNFNINNPFKAGNINTITVEVPWDGFPQLEEGDHVNVYGLIRSWWKDDIGRIIHSFVAQQVEVIKDEEKPKKSRRGTKDPLGGEE